MEKKASKVKRPNFKFWGIVLIVAGIFFLLLFFNMVPSQEDSFKYGRIPVLFVALFFLIFGLISFFNERLKEIDERFRTGLFLVLLILLLVPFHIILFKEKSLDYQYWIFGFIIGIFDLFAIVVFIRLIYMIFWSKK